ncbi:MAG: diguanylate cyclase [Desulfobulbaceae bacterium]|nr:diguanylate cyclase [Desulfobulbaceae bacterium]
MQKNTDIYSVAVYKSDGTILIETKGHTSRWKDTQEKESGATHVKFQLVKDGSQCGTAQICFRPLVSRGIYGYLKSPWLRLSLFLSIAAIPIYWLYLKRTLRHLDPTKVIPQRVKAVLDTLSEGVLVLDHKKQIILANDSFTKFTGQSVSELQGHKVTDFNWFHSQANESTSNFPWDQVILKGDSQKGTPLTLQTQSGKERTFIVNSSPICGTDGKLRGVMATFDDKSEIEEINTELNHSLTLLKDSRNKIKEQNSELKQLAMRDPLTGCLNRRAFFERLDTEWSGVNRHAYALGYIMVDADHFKSVNDVHGHAVGDQVLQTIAEVMKKVARKTDSVCRYGGEEFCILMPQTDIEGTCAAAEKLRLEIEASKPANLEITVSIGVSAHELGATTPQMLLEQADHALYAAKDSGRNKVVRFDQIPEDATNQDEKKTAEPATDKKALGQFQEIPFSAVSALFSALEHRDVKTAIHSRNVANLCVMMAKGLISVGDCFILEIAGLLHDVGKLGVPDSILLKPGSLTDEEQKIMDTHDRIGVQIVSASFGSTELSNIIRFSHAHYGGNTRDPGLPEGKDIPLRSRIVLIADAYDAMTTDRVYRKAMSQADAFEELRQCAGKQFDPELVPQFIEKVLARDENRSVVPLPASQVKALKIGLEIERLACAMEEHDIGLLAAITENIIESASSFEMPEIAELAINIKQAITADEDSMVIMEITNALLELCQSINPSPLPKPKSSVI